MVAASGFWGDLGIKNNAPFWTGRCENETDFG
jgi:hypothetical protein